MSFNWKASGLFAAGVAFGTAGIKILSSKDAKRAYTQCTAAALRAKDCVMKTVNTVQENTAEATQTVTPFLQEQHIFHPQRRNDSFR